MGKRKRNAPYIRTTRKRKRTRRSSRRYSITTLVPKTKMVSLKYSGTFTLGDGTGSLAHYINCNSMFDPDHTGIGHQPLGFDQWMTFYHHYEVYSSKITFWIETLPSIGSSSSHGTYATLRLDSDTNVIATGIESSIERADTKVVYVPSSSGGSGRRSISHSFNANSIFGKNNRGNAAMKGTHTTNPGESTFFVLKLFNSAQSLESEFEHRVVFRMTFLAKLTERKDIAQS